MTKSRLLQVVAAGLMAAFTFTEPQIAQAKTFSSCDYIFCLNECPNLYEFCVTERQCPLLGAYCAYDECHGETHPEIAYPVTVECGFPA